MKKLTKWEMCWEMDRANWRNLPWCVMYDVFKKSEIKEEYEKFEKQNQMDEEFDCITLGELTRN